MRISRRTVADVGLLVLCNTMSAAQYPAYKTASETIRPITLSAWTFLIAAFTLLVPFLFWGRPNSCAGDPAHLEVRPSPQSSLRSVWILRNGGEFLALGVLGLIPASALLAWGTDRSTASNAALIYLTIPIITALLASVMVGERMTPVRWASLFLALAGVLILSDFDWRHLVLASGRYSFANFLILLACTSSSFYNVYSKRLLLRFTPYEVLIYGYLSAVITCVPLLIWVEPFSTADVLKYNAATWISMLVLSGMSWGVAMVLWMYLLKRLDVSQASVSVYLLPFLGVLISSVTLREHITSAMMLGGGVTLIGTILVTSTEVTSRS